MPNQAISLYNSESDGEAIAILGDDTKALGFYGVRDFQTLKVNRIPRIRLYGDLKRTIGYFQITDTNPSTSFTGQLTDVTQVDKFELTPEEYSQRQGMRPIG